MEGSPAYIIPVVLLKCQSAGISLIATKNTKISIKAQAISSLASHNILGQTPSGLEDIHLNYFQETQHLRVNIDLAENINIPLHNHIAIHVFLLVEY